jgi:hypothetical protein
MDTVPGHQVDDLPCYVIVDGPASADRNIGTVFPVNVGSDVFANAGYMFGMFFTSFFPDSEFDRVYELGIDIEQWQFRLAPNRIARGQFREDGGPIHHR